MEAEKRGHSEDVCTYVKADIGMIAKGNLGPDGRPLPDPDLLLLSYTGCFTFMKWFELLREHYKCETAMLHVPYEGDGHASEEHARLRGQAAARRRSFPSSSGSAASSSTSTGCARYLRRIGEGRGGFRLGAGVRRSTKPSPIDAYFGGVYYIGPIFTAFRGTEDAIEYYRLLRAGDRTSASPTRLGPVTPDGEMHEERYRLVVEGPPNWTSFRDFWKMFYDEGAVVVASTYTKVGGLYDLGFRHDPDHPLGIVSREYCLGCYTNRNLPVAHRPDREVRQRVRGGRPSDQLDQELQQLLRRPAAGAARDRAAHRQARAPSSRPISSIPAISRRPTSRTGWRATSR